MATSARIARLTILHVSEIRIENRPDMEPNQYDALVDATKRFAMLAETLERNASETVQQQTHSTQALQQTVAHSSDRIQATIDRAGNQLEQLLKQAVDQAFAPGTQQFEDTARNVASRMQQAAESAQKQQDEIAGKLRRLLWKLNAIAIASTAILLLGGVALIYFQTELYRDARDRAKAAEVDAKVAEAMKKARVTSCGGNACVKLDLKSQRWGKNGEYVLLDGLADDRAAARKR